jgi:hypothetical protein
VLPERLQFPGLQASTSGVKWNFGKRKWTTMNDSNDSQDFPDYALDPSASMFGEVTKDEIWSLLDMFWLASYHRERKDVLVALNGWGILQREPFFTWMREWAGSHGRSRPLV